MTELGWLSSAVFVAARLGLWRLGARCWEGLVALGGWRASSGAALAPAMARSRRSCGASALVPTSAAMNHACADRRPHRRAPKKRATSPGRVRPRPPHLRAERLCPRHHVPIAPLRPRRQRVGEAANLRGLTPAATHTVFERLHWTALTISTNSRTHRAYTYERLRA